MQTNPTDLNLEECTGKYEHLRPTKHQIEFLNAFTTGHWKICRDGAINVYGDFESSGGFYLDQDHHRWFSGGKIPVRFNNVYGLFQITATSRIKTLEGFPRKVKEDFRIHNLTNLRSLEHSPKIVGQVFNFSYCEKLKDLKGFPRKIGNSVYFQGCVNLETTLGITHDIAGKISTGDLKNMDEIELKVLESDELIELWKTSNGPMKDFAEKCRGIIKGRKFGL